jgi:VWFA-related protein
MRKKLGALLLLFVALPTLAQVPYIETLEVRVHSVDVVVTDAKGKPVPNLTREDFQLLEDGVAKPITNFSAFSSAEKRPAPTPTAEATPAAPVEEIKRAPRKFIFYVDEMSLTDPARKKLEAQLQKLLDTSMEAGDEAMIVRPAEEKKLATAFSANRQEVRKALTTAIHDEGWRADAPILREQRLLENMMSGLNERSAKRVAARRWAGIVRARVQQRLGQLRAVVNAAAEVEGRKVLVVITESLPAEPGREAFMAAGDIAATDTTMRSDAGNDSSSAAPGNPESYADWGQMPTYESNLDWVSLRPMIDEIGRSAATNNITIYSVQAEYGQALLVPGGNIGATTPGRDATRPSQQRQPASVARLSGYGMIAMVEEMTTNTEKTLKPLAEMTGGTWHRGGLSFDNLIQEISTDVQSYYSLGYRAGEEFDRAHKLVVRVKGHPELHVRTRQEVIRKSPRREMTDRVVASLLDPADTNELGITLESKQVAVAADRRSKTIYVAARVPMTNLTFIPQGDKLVAKFSVHYAVTGTETDFVSGMHGEQVVEVPADKFEAAKTQNWTYVVPLTLRPDRHVVAIGVLDELSNQSGFARMELDLR